MDFDRVRYFCVFAELGSLVKASEVLRISQPALSKALRLLEQEIGVKLLQPDGRGLRLTEQGKKFHSRVVPLLEKWVALPGSLNSEEPSKITRLGSFEVFTTYFLASLLESFPQMQIEVHEFAPGQIEKAVADKKVDFGVTYLPVPVQGVDFIQTAKIKMGVFGVKKFKNIPVENLPFVIPLFEGQGAPSKVMGLDGWPDHKYTRTIEHKVTLMESALELCRRGYAVAYLPAFIVKLHNQTNKKEYQLIELSCPVPEKERFQEVYLVLAEGSPETAAVRSTAKVLRKLN